MNRSMIVSGVFFIFWGSALGLGFGPTRMSGKFRVWLGGENHVLLRIGQFFLVIGIIAVTLIGLDTREYITENRAKIGKILESIEADSIKIHQMKFIHFFRIANDENYIKTAKYKNDDEFISKYEVSQKETKRDTLLLRQKAEAEFDRRLFLSYALGLLITAVSLSFGGGLLCRAFGQHLTKQIKEDQKRKIN